MTHQSTAGSPLEVPDTLVRLSVGMEQAGATAPPEITFWRKLDLGDDIG